MKYDQSKLEGFFGCKAEILPSPEGDETIRFNFSSKRLKYSIWLHPREKLVLYSADPEMPFGAVALVEISAPCDQVTVCESSTAKPWFSVLFWHGSTEEQTNRTLTINKRPDGDLSVWPNVRVPRRHPLR